MSSGRPHETPCSQVVASLSAYIDGEVGAEGVSPDRRSPHRMPTVRTPTAGSSTRTSLWFASASIRDTRGPACTYSGNGCFRYLSSASRRRSGVGCGEPIIQRAHEEPWGTINAEMVASVHSVEVSPGDSVDAGGLLVVLESMKMEIPVLAEHAGLVEEIFVEVGTVVQEGDALVSLR